MTKTLIIPDIHNKWVDAENIIDRERDCDQVVFLGDYFDDYNDTPEIAYQTAIWLKDSMSKPDRIHLIGNHDLSYIYNGDPKYSASGWNGAKQMFINKVGINWKQLRHHYWVEGWLLTHAGLSNDFYQAYNTDNYLPGKFLNWMLKNNKERLYDTSPSRGGINAFGGILWCDFDEFEPIIGLKQIFGHTADNHIRVKNFDNYCLDTHLKFYAKINNRGSLETKLV